MATRSRSEVAKSSSPRIAASVILADLRGAARPRGEQVDHFTRDQGGVHVHHDQPHRPPVQPAALDGHVHALLGRLAGQVAPQ